MTWSYSGNPKLSAKDQVRFQIGDTNPEDPLLTDEEIEYLLSLYNNTPMNTSIRCCETLVSKFSRLADEAVGQVKISYSQIADTYLKKTIPMLRARLAMEDSQFYAGGISQNDKHTQAMDFDRVKPDFSKHMMENYDIAPWTTQNAYQRWLALED